jgi:hypothetical protein
MSVGPPAEATATKEETQPTLRLRTMADVVQAAAAQHRAAKEKEASKPTIAASIVHEAKTKLMSKGNSKGKQPKETKPEEVLLTEYMHAHTQQLEDDGAVLFCRKGEIYNATAHDSVRPKKVTFGIGKKGMQRTVYRFQKPPEAHPLEVTFEFPNSTLTHQQVLQKAKQRLFNVKDATIERLTFQDRNVVFGAQTMENRWILRLNSLRAREELLSMGLVIYNRKVKVRMYSGALDEDYADVLNYSMQHAVSVERRGERGLGGGRNEAEDEPSRPQEEHQEGRQGRR